MSSNGWQQQDMRVLEVLGAHFAENLQDIGVEAIAHAAELPVEAAEQSVKRLADIHDPYLQGKGLHRDDETVVVTGLTGRALARLGQERVGTGERATTHGAEHPAADGLVELQLWHGLPADEELARGLLQEPEFALLVSRLREELPSATLTVFDAGAGASTVRLTGRVDARAAQSVSYAARETLTELARQVTDRLSGAS